MVHDDNLVTIVTVTYNAGDLLEKTILSVINQSYKDIEYIIIDGGSKDKTVDIIKKYEDKIAYWVSEPDDGIYYAMNKSIEKATGEWINFMNAGDTFADKQTVSYLMGHKSNDAELIYGNYKKKKADQVVKAHNKKNWFRTMPFNHQTLFTKVSVMKKNPFNTKYKIAADHNFILSMYKANKKFYYFDKTLAIFVEGGFAHSNTVAMCIESIQILLDNDVDVENIYRSSWYKYLNQDTKYKDKLAFLNMFLEKNHLESKYLDIMQQFSKMAKIQAWKHPIKKFRAYKKLLSLYHQQK